MSTVDDLAAFLRARWDEEEEASTLFHELDCPGPRQAGGGSICSCPWPAQVRARIATHRLVLADCEQRIQHEQDVGPCWPVDSVLAFTAMKALALPFELHPAWQDSWYP